MQRKILLLTLATVGIFTATAQAADEEGPYGSAVSYVADGRPEWTITSFAGAPAQLLFERMPLVSTVTIVRANGTSYQVRNNERIACSVAPDASIARYICVTMISFDGRMRALPHDPEVKITPRAGVSN